MLIIRYPVLTPNPIEPDTGEFAIVGECSVLDYPRYEALMSLLASQCEAWGGFREALSDRATWRVMELIAALMPRLDIKGYGFPLNGLSVETLEQLFNGVESRLAALHIPPPNTEEEKLVTDSEKLVKEALAITSSGDAVADSLAVLLRCQSPEIVPLLGAIGFRRLSLIFRQLEKHNKDPEDLVKEKLLENVQRYADQHEEEWKLMTGEMPSIEELEALYTQEVEPNEGTN